MVAFVSAAAVLLTHLWFLGGPPLARTEAHRALTGHEILQTGHWLVPTLYGDVYLRKPPGFYWVVAVSESIFGANGWGWRLPSALASAGMAGAAALFAARWFGARAGLIAGLSYLALIPLWAQGRSADIDALNMFASASAALLVLHLNWSGAARPGAAAGLLALAVAVMMMVKGPAGGAPLLAAMVAPSLLLRDWRPLRRPALWLALGAGVAVFAVWAISAWVYVHRHGLVRDLRGVDELVTRVAGRGLTQWIEVIRVPFELFAYALPFSLAALVATRPAVLATIDLPAARLARALVATLAGSLLLGVLAGVNNVRYAYVVVPLICPLVGLVGAAWAEGSLNASAQKLLRQVMTVTTLGYALFAALLLRKLWIAHVDRSIAAVLLVLLIAATLFSLASWVRQRAAAGAAGVLAVVLVLGLAYAHHRNFERTRFSAHEAGLTLREAVGAGSTVTTDMMVMARPELFYYAQVHVDYRFSGFEKPHELESAMWIVFHETEWAKWKAAMPGRFSQVQPLAITGDNAVVARYTPAGN